MGQIYGMIDCAVLEKYIQKYERYADMARDRAEELGEKSGDGVSTAECSNYGEAYAYAHVARDLRAMLNGIVDED
jgi:hypothetical protein